MSFVYYPSCNFQKFFPETAKRIRAYLSQRPEVTIAGCCHRTAQIPVEGDTILTVCRSCMRTLSETRADIPNKSLFEYLLDLEDFSWPDLGGENITVQDCFRARGDHGLQDAVRECLLRMNAVPVEMPNNRDEEMFDGAFLFHEPYPQNMQEAPKYFRDYLKDYIIIVPEEEWESRFREHARGFTTKRVVGYCNTCVKSLRDVGVDCVHLAELIFG